MLLAYIQRFDRVDGWIVNQINVEFLIEYIVFKAMFVEDAVSR
ncbi:MAG: hypothetical protein Dbin4_03018, partial [Alphaproteobacteria bacterium]|nr:hypothetical protein [Alphaproteobacteria bacterium]